MFVVSIDLSEYFTNHKKQCCVAIRDEWIAIKCLQRHVKDIFKLRRIQFMNEDHEFIPASEPIDIIKVFQKKPFKLIGVSIRPVKLPASVDFTSDKQKTYKSNDWIEKAQKKLEAISLDDNVNMKSNQKQIITNICNDRPTLPEPTSSKDIAHTKKRKRVRKNKTQTDQNVSNKTTEYGNEPTNSKFISNNELLVNSHLLFDKDDGLFSKNRKFEINFKNYLENYPNSTPRIFKTIVDFLKGDTQNEGTTKNDLVHKTENFRNTSSRSRSDIIILEDKLIATNSLNSFVGRCNKNEPKKRKKEPNDSMEKKNEIVYVNESDSDDVIATEEKLSIKPIDQKTNANPIKIPEVLSLCKPLEGLPNINDVLVFKIYRLNQSYEPTISDFICGVLESIIEEENDKLLRLNIVEGQDQLADPNGKFSLPCQDDYTTEYLKIKLKELFDVRVLIQ